MKLSHLIAIIGFLSITTSCSKDVAYYQFTESDYEYMTNYELGDIINFRNQDNKDVVMEVVKLETSKEGMGADGYSLTTPMFYFDYKQIVLMDVKNDDYFIRIEFEKYPKQSKNALLNASISFFAMNDPDMVRMDIDFDSNFEQMTIDEDYYSKVLVYKTYSNESTYMDHLGYYKNINTLYYDIEKGVIGFNDTNGKSWKKNKNK